MNLHTVDHRRILIIDDNQAIHADYRKILAPADGAGELQAAKAALFGSLVPPAGPAPRFEIDAALQGREGVEKVQAARAAGAPYMVAFVDMRMPPGWDGATTVRNLWAVDPSVQVVICTAFSDQSLENAADELDSSDKLVIVKKPFDKIEVLQLAKTLSEKWLAEQAASAKMTQLDRLVRDRTAEIEHATLHDRLTDLPNRAHLLTRLEACIARRRQNRDHHFALLFIDFDRFKLINDSLGHEHGDRLLIEIANRLRATLRSMDPVSHAGTPARLGGDEFLVLLEGLRHESDAARTAQRLLDVLAEPYVIDGHKLFSTASIGIATSDRAYERAGDMIRDADTAMYRAKAAGRARFVPFDREMHDEVLERASLESELRQAVRDDALDLHYQPIIRLHDGHLSGFEALVRWSRADGRAVPAPRIVSIAEETGLILPMSLGLLRRACGQLKIWSTATPPPPT